MGDQGRSGGCLGPAYGIGCSTTRTLSADDTEVDPPRPLCGAQHYLSRLSLERVRIGREREVVVVPAARPSLGG